MVVVVASDLRRSEAGNTVRTTMRKIDEGKKRKCHE